MSAITSPELVTKATALLRTALASADVTCDVEEYVRPEPASKTTVYVQPSVYGGEEASDLNINASKASLSGGTFFERLTLRFYCETPADAQGAAASTLSSVVEVVKSVAQDNRDIEAASGNTAAVGIWHGGNQYFGQRQGAPPGAPILWIADVTASWRR